MRPRSSACPSPWSRGWPPTCRSATITRRAGAAAATRCSRQLKPLLEDPARRKLGHHLKYDTHVLANYGIRCAGMRSTPCWSPTCWNSVATRHDMDSGAERYLGTRDHQVRGRRRQGRQADLFRPGAGGARRRYAAEDADVTLRLHQALWPQLRARPAARSGLRGHRAAARAGAHRDGARRRADRCDQLRAQSRELARALLELSCRRIAKPAREFNLDSPEPAAGDPVRAAAAAGAAQDADRPAVHRRGRAGGAGRELRTAAHDPRLPRAGQAESTYTDKLPEQVNARTGRVHTCYHQAVAATGRLSSTDPNLQNIPVRTAEGRRIRQAFIAPPGWSLAADYSQIELRIMAHLSGDASAAGRLSPRTATCTAPPRRKFSASQRGVSADQRRAAKAINFGLIYGMSPFGLARQLGIERGDAQQLCGLYFARYPGVQALHGRDARAGARAGLCRDRVRPPAVSARHPLAQSRAAPVRRTHRHQRAHAGHRSRHHQARHDRGGCLAEETALRRGSSCRCTTSWCWKCAEAAGDE